MTGQEPSRPAPGDRARRLVASMREICARLERLCDEHESLMGEGRYDAFVRSLARRADDIARLEHAGKAVDGILNGRDTDSGLGADELTRLRAEVETIGASIARVLERDAALQERVERERDSLASQLSGVGATRSAVRAYSGAARTPNPRLQDRRG